MSKRTSIIFTILVGYVVMQFLWWEVLLVQQSNDIIAEKQKIAALSSTDDNIIKRDIAQLQHKRDMKVYMITGEGTVFLLILLFGVLQVRKSIKKETELANQQRNFVLSVSHELKTPIAASKLQLQTLLKHELDRDKQKQLLNNALTETERLHKLVENVLLVNQIGNNNLNVQKSSLNVSEFVEQLVKRYFSSYIDTKQIVLNLQPNAQAQLDKDLFPSVIINLIENAIKYSFEEVLVTVKLYTKNQHLMLEVSDVGCGISDKEKQKVFEKFFRSGDENTRRTKGTGIGLYIVKTICDLHETPIQVTNNSPKGTSFQIQLS